MFFIKKILILFGIISVILTVNNQAREEYIIPNDSIRFRVISNSDSELDVRIKMELKEYIENVLFDLIKDASSSNEVDLIIKSNFDYINNKIGEYLSSNDYSLDYGINYFPSKIYKNVVYDEGYYKSLVITLGNGLGHNWWCVLFPPLCLLDTNSNTSDVEYKLYVSRIINSVK